MSFQDPNLQQRALYWEKRRTLQAKIQQMDAALAGAGAALLEGRIPAAKPLFLEAQQAEQAAQQLADQINFSGPAGRVVAAFGQTLREKLDAIVQDQQIAAAGVRMQFQAIAEIEQALTGGEPVEAPALLTKALFEKSEQANKDKQFDRAEDFLDQIVKLDPANIQARIRLAEVLLQRANYSSKAVDGEAALVFVRQATASYERVKDSSEFAGRRDDFERKLAEEQNAAYFAAGKQARGRGRLLRARQYFRRVPAASTHGAQAREEFSATTRLLAIGAVVGVVLLGAALALRLAPARAPGATPTTVAQASASAAIALSATSLSATAPIQPSASVLPAATPALTSEPTAAPPTPSISPPTPTSVVLLVKTVRDGVAVYEKADRAKSGSFLFYVPIDRTYYLCDRDDKEGSYLIALTPCNSSNIPLGWVKQENVKLLIATPTSTS